MQTNAWAVQGAHVSRADKYHVFWSYSSQHPMYNITNRPPPPPRPKEKRLGHNSTDPFCVRQGNFFFSFKGCVLRVSGMLYWVSFLPQLYIFLPNEMLHSCLACLRKKKTALTLSSSPPLLFAYRFLYFLLDGNRAWLVCLRVTHAIPATHFRAHEDHSWQAHNLAHTRHRLLPDTHGYAHVPDAHRSVAHGATKFRRRCYLSPKEGPRTTIDSIELDRV